MSTGENLSGSENLKTIDVRQDSWMDCRLDTVLRTDSVEPCIVIAVYNPGKGAILGHFSDPMDIYEKEGSRPFSSMVRQLQLNPSDKSDWRVWIGGGSTVDFEGPQYSEMIDHNVEHILKQIKSAGIQESSIEFGLSGQYESLSVEINSNDGTISVNAERTRKH